MKSIQKIQEDIENYYGEIMLVYDRLSTYSTICAGITQSTVELLILTVYSMYRRVLDFHWIRLCSGTYAGQMIRYS
jgi:hypothetical protein